MRYHVSATSRVSRDCKNCGAGFLAKRHWQLFCSVKCKNLFHVNERRKAMELYQQTKGEDHGHQAG